MQGAPGLYPPPGHSRLWTWLQDNEDTVIAYSSWAMLASAAATWVALTGTEAPYGRYSGTASRIYGCPMPGRVAWMIQELPSFGVPVACLWLAGVGGVATPNLALLALFLLHYTNRVFVFPLRLRGSKPTPCVVMLLAFAFCLWNGYTQGRFLTRYAVYPDDWLTSPQFIVGTTLFLVGMYTNWRSDSILMNLRKPGETGYKIPKGFVFEYVSGANYFGEILEWTGFAVACWSLPAAAFAVFTFCNIGPRAAHHHRWYQSKFKGEYPASRKAVIPFVW